MAGPLCLTAIDTAARANTINTAATEPAIILPRPKRVLRSPCSETARWKQRARPCRRQSERGGEGGEEHEINSTACCTRLLQYQLTNDKATASPRPPTIRGTAAPVMLSSCGSANSRCEHSVHKTSRSLVHAIKMMSRTTNGIFLRRREMEKSEDMIASYTQNACRRCRSPHPSRVRGSPHPFSKKGAGSRSPYQFFSNCLWCGEASQNW